MPIEELIDKTIVKIDSVSVYDSMERKEIIFHTNTGESWKMYHEQDCLEAFHKWLKKQCESVSVDDVCGDWNDLLFTPIIQAFEKSSGTKGPEDVADQLLYRLLGLQNREHNQPYNVSFTWTFYTLSTIKGTVTIRWYGSSNGYYSESVSVKKVGEGKE